MHPRKRFGQHFLIDGNLMRRLVDLAELGPEDVVLEVGVGTGGLTDLLVPRARRVIGVEIDRDLHALVQSRFADDARLTLILGDALGGKHRIAPPVALLLEACSDPIKLVANLPYQAATPLVLNLLESHPRVRRLVFTVQKEVAERLVSPPGCKDFGPLSILAQTLARVELAARIPPSAFWPRPAVDSAMVRMDVIDPPPLPRDRIPGWATLVRGAFLHRRKTLRSALRYVLEEDALARVCDRFEPTRRPESIGVEDWLAMERLIND